MALTLEMDVAEPRVVRDRLVAAMEGRTMDPRVSGSGVWKDPVTETVFLRPFPTLDEWGYTTAGSYARLAKADYSLPTPGNWVENHIGAVGNIYLESLGSNERVTTTASYGANRAMYLAGYVFGKTGEALTVLECGWGDPATGVSLRMRGTGDFEIWKGGVHIADYGGSGSLFDRKGKKGTGGLVGGQFFQLLLIPCRLRELLVCVAGADGGGFSHVFEDLDPVAGNTITPAGSFWWYVPPRPSGGYQKASIQCAPLRWSTSGTVYGQVVSLRAAPATGDGFASLVGGAIPSGCALFEDLVDAGTLASFVPDGTRRVVRAGCTLTGPGDASPEVYSLDFYSAPTVVDTTDDPFDLTPYVETIELSVPERGAATITIHAFSPGAMEAAGLDRPRTVGNRPIRLALDGVDLFRGVVDVPTVDEGAALAPCDTDTLCTWRGEDRTRQFARRRFLHTLPLDGLTFTASQADLAVCAGFGAGDVDITVDTFLLPFSPAVSQGDWQLLPRLGETVRQWQERLIEDFARTWIEGWTPTLSGYKWRCRRPDTYSSTPALEMWLSEEDAALAALVPREWIPRRVVTGLRERALPSEGNRVMVVGYDRRTESEIYSIVDDVPAQDPAIAIASRPPHWSGEVDMIAMVDGDGINDQPTANRARDIIAQRAIPVLGRWEMDCEFLQRRSDNRPLWKGDVVRVYDPSPDGVSAPTEYGDLRIISIPTVRMESEDDATPAMSSRPSTYLVEVIATSTGCVTFKAPVAPTLTTFAPLVTFDATRGLGFDATEGWSFDQE